MMPNRSRSLPSNGTVPAPSVLMCRPRHSHEMSFSCSLSDPARPSRSQWLLRHQSYLACELPRPDRQPDDLRSGVRLGRLRAVEVRPDRRVLEGAGLAMVVAFGLVGLMAVFVA